MMLKKNWLTKVCQQGCKIPLELQNKTSQTETQEDRVHIQQVKIYKKWLLIQVSRL